MKNKISVIIPCYNQGKFINQTVESVLNQTYQNFEIIIVNDGSTDEYTNKLLRGYDKPRTRVFNTENQGASSARNFGFEKSNGEFIQFLDADDFLDPFKFEKQMNVFKENKGVDVVYSNYKYYLEKEKIFFDPKKYNPNLGLEIKEDPYEEFLFNWQRTLSIPLHSPIFRRKVWGNKSPFVEGFGVGEDWIMWVNIAQNGSKFYFIDEELAFYRLHGKSMTHNKSYSVYWASRAISFIAENYVTKEYKGKYNKISELYLNDLIESIFIKEYKDIVHSYEEKLKEIENSIAWKIFKPFRSIIGSFKKMFSNLRFYEKIRDKVGRLPHRT